MADQPRTVLMICYYFPPIQASGTTRSKSFAENLQAFGWTPVVLTVADCRDPWVKIGSDKAEGIRVERTYEWNLAKLADFCHAVHVRLMRIFGVELKTNYFREFFCIPDTQLAWFSTWAGVRLARQADAVYVSCSPFSSALSGAKIKLITGKPLVVDFRDAWSLNPHTKFGRFHKLVTGLMERIVIKTADRFIVNTDGAARLYRKKYPQHAAKISAIPNGYDELTPVNHNADPDAPFRIMHVGSFYGSRSPRLLFEALAKLSGRKIEFIQVGPDFDVIEEFKNRLNITVIKPVPRAKALELMATASLLYLKQGWEPGVSDYIAVAAKTYEYIATGLPILAEVPPGDNADIVSRYAKNSYVITSNDASKVQDAVEKAYSLRAEVRPEIDSQFKADFDRKRLTGRLAAMFDEISRTSPRSQELQQAAPGGA